MKSTAPQVVPILICLLAPCPVWSDPAPAEKAKEDARLDAVLREWAKASDTVHEAHFTIRVSQRDSLTEKITPATIEVFIRKPDLMRIDSKDDKNGRISLVYKERIVRVLSSSNKTDVFHPLSDAFGFPAHPERYPDDFFSSIGGGILERCSWLASGLPVRDLKARFDLHLEKEDDYWLYVEIKPRNSKDRMDLRKMQVVLNRKTYEVRRLWIESPNNNETTYDYEPPRTNSVEPITPESILKGLPTDYKKVSFDP